MRRRNGFIPIEQVRQGADPASAMWKVTGEDACAVAFVPSVTRAELAHCGVGELDEELTPAFDALLGEGTKAPPASFSGPDELLTVLRQREHRGALAIVQPTLTLDRDDRVVAVQLAMTSGRVGAGFVHRNGNVIVGMGGATDKRRHRITLGDHYARVDVWQRFVMGFAGDLDGRFPGAEVAPLGWLMISYFLHADGAAQAWCASSFLPSAWFYRDYVRMHRRALEDATAVEAEAVLRPKPDVATGTRWACLDTSTGCINAVAG